jgi:hypothetical protein
LFAVIVTLMLVRPESRSAMETSVAPVKASVVSSLVVCVPDGTVNVGASLTATTETVFVTGRLGLVPSVIWNWTVRPVVFGFCDELVKVIVRSAVS